MDNQTKFQNSKEVIAYLAERFPNSFFLKGEMKPLKIGIFHDIVACLHDDEKGQLLSNKQLRLALRLYTSSWRYLEAIVDGASRLDLDGKTCETIDDVQETHAKARLVESRAQFAKGKKESAAKSHKNDKKEQGAQADKKPARKKAVKNNTGMPKDNNVVRKPKVTAIESLDLLKVEQPVKIVVGKDVHNAIIVEIAKESAKVRLNSGLEVMVRKEHIMK